MKTTVSEELEQIAKLNGGMLNPEKVIAYAKKRKTSALHERFNWDDTEAAHQYRLDQARKIIRVNVTVMGSDTKPVRAFVSLRNDRGEGGYRRTIDVLASPVLKADMLTEAKEEMEVFVNKYRRLKELAPVIAAIDAVLTPGGNKKAGAKRKGRQAATVGV